MEEVVNRVSEIPSNLGFSLDMTKIDVKGDAVNL
jgi:hypothetical protein